MEQKKKELVSEEDERAEKPAEKTPVMLLETELVWHMKPMLENRSHRLHLNLKNYLQK